MTTQHLIPGAPEMGSREKIALSVIKWLSVAGVIGGHNTLLLFIAKKFLVRFYMKMTPSLSSVIGLNSDDVISLSDFMSCEYVTF